MLEMKPKQQTSELPVVLRTCETCSFRDRCEKAKDNVPCDKYGLAVLEPKARFLSG